MQSTILNIAEELEGAGLVDSHLSFGPFVEFLKDRKFHEKTMKVKFLEFVIGHFERRLQDKDQLSVEETGEYEDLLQLIYATIFPAIEDERQSLWALSVPLKPVIFYGTESFYGLLKDPVTGTVRATLINKDQKIRKRINLEFIYTFILRRLYNHTVYFPASTLIHSFQDAASGISKIYRLNVDTRFVRIVPKGPLPNLDHAELQAHLHGPAAFDFLKQSLPLSMFRFEGISAITVTDITADHVLENIRNIILDRTDCGGEAYYDEVVQSLKSLTGKGGLDFGLMPFLKVNGRPVFSDEICMHSIVASMAKHAGEAEDVYMSLAENYIADPRPIFFERITAANEGAYFFLSALRENGVKAYGLLPVFYNNHLAGVLEVYSREEGVLDQETLSGLDIAIPLLAQLLQRTIDEFETKLEAIIKKNFTSIQPAVEWKFNEAAWNFLKEQHAGEYAPGLETIYFKTVYPLYGAIDIRNSTIERNRALRNDLQTQFHLLIRILSDLEKEIKLELLAELIFQCKKWEGALTEALTTAEEMDLNGFLKNEIGLFLVHFKESRPDMAVIIEPYMEAIDESTGIAFRNRRELEASIQSINGAINRHLEAVTEEFGQSYPVYFEKFRTDGVEYDIYIGQSIVPGRPFDILYLNNLRLWQLSSMAAIARLTSKLLVQMPDKLHTTQLIFVHSNPIDISFRKDERRFDVEGGYNIRYQVVKKRIDKVHVKGGNERLTQPGKIAVIYFNDKEAEEYAGYIRYLQEKGVLEDDREDLELEDLQGVSGLKAFRIGVRPEGNDGD